jgi:hypothetical protein
MIDKDRIRFALGLNVLTDLPWEPELSGSPEFKAAILDQLHDLVDKVLDARVRQLADVWVERLHKELSDARDHLPPAP